MTSRYIFVLDKSGSMDSMGTEPVTMVKNYIKNIKNKNSNFMLITFSDPDYEEVKNINVCVDSVVSNINLDTLLNDWDPDGMTALNDAIGYAIELNEQYENVQLIIITDGEENSSLKYTRHDIKKKIKFLTENKGWNCLYFGANQNTEKEAYKLGISREKSAPFNSYESGSLSNAVKNMSAEY